MSLLSVVKDVCAVVGVTIPTSVFASITGNRTMQEMLALANEMAQRIAYDTREFRQMKTQMTFTGDGVTTAYNLPANYLRMLLTGNVWRSTSALQPMQFIPEIDRWNQRRILNLSDAWGEWTLLGNQILFDAPMAAAVGSTPAVTARFPYLDRNCVVLNAGGMGATFVNDADSFRLDERLLKLGMIWQWKANKGSPYAEDMGTYSDALQMALGADKPAPIIIDRVPSSATIPTSIAMVWPPGWGSVTR